MERRTVVSRRRIWLAGRAAIIACSVNSGSSDVKAEAERRLVSLNVSPWSERAKWALDHHGLAYETTEHVPFLGERRLRKLVGKRGARATVPALIVGREVLGDSWDIALYADREGKGTALVPPHLAEPIRAWNVLADETMAAGRGLVVAALLASPEALEEAVPWKVPISTRWLFRPIVRYATTWFAGKYELRFGEAAAHRTHLRSTLETLRRALAKDPPYLFGTFSYADIVMASCLQGICPVADRFVRLGPATRRVWTREDIAADFGDLVRWRDDLYERHRGGCGTAPTCQ